MSLNRYFSKTQSHHGSDKRFFENFKKLLVVHDLGTSPFDT